MNNAKIAFELVSSYQNSGLPALVGNVGVIGEYFITPDNHRQFEIGFQPDGVEADSRFASNLNDAVSILNEKFGVDVDDLSLMWQLELALNSALAIPHQFYFLASDAGLSSNPSLSFEDKRGTFYIVFDEDFHAGFIAVNNDTGGEEDVFAHFEEAVTHLIAKYGVKIADESKREVKNFQDMARILKHYRNK